MVVDSGEQIEKGVSFLLQRRDGPSLLELKISGEDMPPMNFEASLKF
jgi:hypothetical protein